MIRMNYFIISIFATTALLITAVNTLSEDSDVGFNNLLLKIVNGFITKELPAVLQHNFTIIKPVGYVFSDALHFLADGHINLTEGVKIWGLYNTNTSTKNGEAVATDNTTKASIWLDLPISEMGLALGYDVDLGILGSLPIYGQGELVIAVSKVEVNISLFLVCPSRNPFVNLSIENFNFDKLSVHHSHSYITGFWNNAEADHIITKAINIVEYVIILFFNAQKDCIICVLDAIIEYFVNRILHAHPTLNIDCPCLHNSVDEPYNIKDAIYDTVQNFQAGDFEGALEQLADENVRNFYYKAFSIIYEFAKKEGFLQEINELVN